MMKALMMWKGLCQMLKLSVNGERVRKSTDKATMRYTGSYSRMTHVLKEQGILNKDGAVTAWKW